MYTVVQRGTDDTRNTIHLYYLDNVKISTKQEKFKGDSLPMDNEDILIIVHKSRL
jgi:hypothetical protein